MVGLDFSSDAVTRLDGDVIPTVCQRDTKVYHEKGHRKDKSLSKGCNEVSVSMITTRVGAVVKYLNFFDIGT